MKTTEKILCDYNCCEKEISEESAKFTPPTARYCIEHDEIFNNAVDKKDNKKLLSMLMETIL